VTSLTRWARDSVRAAGWAPALVFFVHQLIPWISDVQAQVPTFDNYEHAVGGLAIGYFFWRAFGLPSATDAVGTLTIFGRVSSTFGAVCAAAVLWEFSEWITDRLGWTGAQAGLGDTLLDMLLGIVGGTTVITIGVLSRREGRDR
jgi:hypothetical protein